MVEIDVDMAYLTDYGESDPPDTVVLNDENGMFPPVRYVREDEGEGDD